VTARDRVLALAERRRVGGAPPRRALGSGRDAERDRHHALPMHSRRHRRAAAALAGVAATLLLATGCGSVTNDPAKTAYVDRLNQAETALARVTRGINAVPHSSDAQLATRLAAGATATDALARRFATVKPPADATHAHGKIVNGLHQIAATFRSAAGYARTHQDAKLADTLNGIDKSTGVRAIQSAQNELTSRGYHFKKS
jgi:hypothetical protein